VNGALDLEVTLDEHQKAFAEVSFLIDIFTTTIDLIMGGATTSVGRIAGREMARKLPLYLQQPSLAEVVRELATQMQGGFEFSLADTGAEQELVFQRCLFQDVCAARGLPLGGPTCKLFHAYLDGQINELLSRPVKSELLEWGPKCRARLRTQ